MPRDAARALSASGKDPSQAKQEWKRLEKEGRGLTFESQATADFDKTKKEGRAETPLVKTKWLLDRAVEDFGAKPMSEITLPIALRCPREMEAKGNFETAKRLWPVPRTRAKLTQAQMPR